MKKIQLKAIVALLLVFAMLLPSCAPKGTEPQETQPAACTHTNTSLQGAKAATCVEEGYTGNTVCNDCTAIVKTGTAIPKTAHTYDSGKVTKNPTCIDTGLTTFTCTGCGTTVTSPIATVSHSDTYHDAQDGTHFHTCKTCPLNENTAHRPTDNGTFFAATCTEPAYTEYTCADCKGVYKVYDESLAALNHLFGDWELIADSTCQSTGEKVQVCQREGCGEKNVVTIPVSTTHNYSFSHYESTPNCTNSGLAVYTCDDCGIPQTKELAKNGVHSYEALENTGDGWVRKQCVHCGDVTASFDASTLVEAKVSVDAINTDTALEMNMQSAAIQFPQDVVGQIASGSNLSVSADVLDESAKENAISNITDEAEKEALLNAPIYDFTVKVDDAIFSDNFSTKVAITISYDNGDGDEEGIVIYYLAENGEIEKITDVTYNAETKEVTFFVEHFSFYAVAYKETQAMRCKRGNHSYESTGVTVAATCYSFGYTVYECVGCHKSTFDDIVERTGHNYGGLIDANPTCDAGDYITRVCQNAECGHVLNVKFVGATGHTMDKPATCTTPSTCTKCNQIITRALGHAWTNWETVVAATGSTEGLRRRYCTNCGGMEESTTAATGEIDAITYESYEELVNKIFGEVLNITSGVLEFEFSQYDSDVKITVELMKDGNGYRAKATQRQIYYYGGGHAEATSGIPAPVPTPVVTTAIGEKTGYATPVSSDNTYSDPNLVDRLKREETYEFYYDNGVWVALYDYKANNNNYDSSGITFGDINCLIPAQLDVFKAIAEDLYADIDSYAVSYRNQLEALVNLVCVLAGDSFDKAMAEKDLPYTADQLKNLVDSIETVYAYLSLKLGFASGIQKVEGVTKPTAEDWENVLAAFMESTQKDGITTYTLNEAPIIDLIDQLVAFVEGNLETSVADFIYVALEDTFANMDAGITSFDGFVSYLKKNFPGNYTVSDAVDMLIESAKKDNLTAEDVYASINTIVEMMGESGFDAEEFVKQNGTITLDELVQNSVGDASITVEDFYDAYAQMLKDESLKNLPTPYGTVADLCKMWHTVKDNMQLGSNLSISIDAQGRITAFAIDHDLLIRENFDPNGEFTKINSLKVNIARNDNLVVEIPAQLKANMRDVEYYYDEQGNLVITGLDKNIDYEFDLYGYAYVDYKEILQKDDTLTKEYGKTVYVTKPEYWTNTNHIGTYYLVDGQYYAATNTYFTYAEATSTLPLNDFLANVQSYCFVNTDYIRGYLAGHNDVPVYDVLYSIPGSYHTAAVGIAYCINGVWTASSHCGTVNNAEYIDPNTGDWYSYYYVLDTTTLDNFYSTIQLSSVNPYYSGENYYVYYNGEYYHALTAEIQFGKNGYTYNILAAQINGETLIVNGYNGWYGNDVFEPGTPVQLPKHDTSDESATKLFRKDANGKIYTIEAKRIALYELIPAYYIQVNDESYIRLDSSYIKSSYDTNGMQALALPDGNTLYVMGETYDNEYNHRYGYKTVYGYAKTVDGFYVQCAILFSGNDLVEVKYRNASQKASISFSNLYNINDYLRKDATGKYIVDAALINQLKALCQEPGSIFYIDICADLPNDAGYVQYYVGAYMVASDVSLNTNSNYPVDDYYFWYQLFSDNHGGSMYDYNVVKNADGSITIVFANGVTISEINYNYGIYIPVESELVKDTVMSQETGLNIYKFEDKYVSTHNSNSYVYQNGKYYEYDTRWIYDILYLENANFFADWYIRDFTYRFDMVGVQGMPANLPVYETELWFNLKYSNSNTGYSYVNERHFATLYTFYLDGVLNVAVEASVTGESLLTFESYMPLDEYIASLETDIQYTNYHWSNVYVGNGKYVDTYSAYIYVYETDGNGNRLGGDYKTYWEIPYVVENGTKKFVSLTEKYNYNSYELVIGSIADRSHIPANATRNEYTGTYANGTFTMVYFSWDAETCNTYYYVKLAGRMYLYEYGSYYYYDGSYQAEKLNEWEFLYQAVDKAWVYRLDVTDQYGNILYSTYYSEFIPSDNGFVPSGTIVDPSVIEEIYSETILGYTADGNPIYEIAYWVTEDASPYTKETQSDGTVFYHKNGVGYLEVTQKYGNKYYVRARKVTMNDGSTQIYCFLRGAVIRPRDIHNDTIMDKYVSVSGNKVTISADFLNTIEERDYYNYVIYLYTNWSSIHFTYYELESLFLMAK